MSSSKKIDLQRDFAAGVYHSLQTGVTVSHSSIIRPSFVNCCPYFLLSGSILPLSPSLSQRGYTQTVCGW
jgi:hypothetical protein